MPDSDDSGSESDMSEGARAARDRLAPKTQKDYASFLNGLSKFALDHRAQYAHLIQNDKILLPVSLELGKAYLAHCRDTLVAWPLDPRPEATRTGLKHYSTQKINGVISAIQHSYCKLSIAMPPNEAKFYNDFQHAYRHVIAAAKACSAYPAQAGTVAMTMASVIRLLNAALKHVPAGKGAKESSVRRLWLYILLAIATCGRGERVGRVQFEFISWVADCLSVQIPTSKSDIEGLMSYAKLCAANPWNPLCCLPTALGVEFLSRDDSSSAQFLFGDSDKSTNYMITQIQTAMKTVMNAVGEENLGATFDRLTGHFLKKTAIGFMRSNHECVSNDSRELRADHKVGPYNQRSEQDGVVGRVLAFLKPGSNEFACAPPHFHPDVVTAIPWAVIVPFYEQYSVGTQRAIHACVASVVHNVEFIKKNLSKSHPFHGCHLMKTQSKWVQLLQPHILGGRSGFKPIMEATGQSLISKIVVDLGLIRKGGSSEAISATNNSALVEEIVELRHAVTDLKHVISGHVVSQPASAGATALLQCQTPKFYIGYITEKFPFPVSLSVEDSWRRWHCGDKPLRTINSKMLLSSLSASERERQLNLRRKMKAVMEILQGQTQNQTVDIDPIFVWKSCWTRAVALFRIPLPCTWTLSTTYDFFCKSSGLVKAAREAASVSVPDVAIAAAATATQAAEDARTFAVAAAAHRPVRDGNVVDANSCNELPNDSDVMSTAHVASVIESIRQHSEQIGAAAASGDVHDDASSSLPLLPFESPSTAMHAFWPVPANQWMLGCVQCARVCNTCKSKQWQADDRQIAKHFWAHHSGVPQLNEGLFGSRWLVTETAWCVKGLDGDGKALEARGLPWIPFDAVMTKSKRRRVTLSVDGVEVAAQQDAASRSYEDARAQLEAASTYFTAQQHAALAYVQSVAAITTPSSLLSK